MPIHVEHARNVARNIPSDIVASLVLPQDATVSQLLTVYTRFPPQIEEQPFFAPDNPTALLSDKHHQPSGAERHIQASVASALALRTKFDNAWLSGARSICLPSDPSQRYPLWVEKLIQQMVPHVTHGRTWSTRAEWLEETSKLSPACAALAMECQESFEVLPWKGLVPGFGPAVRLTMMDLARFLSKEWLHDEMINAGLDYILRDMQKGSRIMLVNCLFFPNLREMYKRGHLPKNTTLADSIRRKDIDLLFFPLHVNNSHWTLLTVDLVDHTYSYSDSLLRSASLLKETADLLQRWLEQLRPEFSTKPLRRAGTALCTLPRQHDSDSCGIIVLSTLAHHLLRLEPWTDDTKGEHRMQWFLRLSEGLQDTSESSDDQDPSCTVALNSLVLQTALERELQLDDITLDLNNNANSDSLQPKPASRKRALSSADILRQPKRVQRGEHGPIIHDSKHGRAQRPEPQSPTVAFRPTGAADRKFTKSILAMDARAEFDPADQLRVRCSSCNDWKKMRKRHDTANFRKHRETEKCAENQKGGSTPSLRTFFSPVQRSTQNAPNLSTSPSKQIIRVPCPGLTKESSPDVARYLCRTATAGGGAPSRSRIANALYETDNLLWRELKPSQKRAVQQREVSLYQWRNFRPLGTVFSVRCVLLVTVSSLADEPPTCMECQSLLSLRSFQVQLSRPIPSEQNMKFVPKLWRDEDMGVLYIRYRGLQKLVEMENGRSPWLKFSQGVVDGTYSNSEILLGMVRALVVKTDRLKQGKSLRGMTYTRVFSDFANMMASLAPRAYESFRQHLGGPTTRSLRQTRAKAPRFKPGLSLANVQAAKAVIRRLGYNGPLSLSWDDTALEPALAIFQESKDGMCTILGGAAGEIEVKSESDLDRVFQDACSHQADKLRLYAVGVPLHKVPPMIVAAVARKGSDNADALHALHLEILRLLHSVEIYPISMSADGTEVERSLQSRINDSAVQVVEYEIPNSLAACRITLRLHFQDQDHPFVTLQDSNHARKTGRNQLFTGARLLVMGRCAMFYSQLRDCVIGVVSPLFHRDVEKVDRQDDRAAARLTSSAFLAHVLALHPERSALAVYLFILGEMIDAWQNRLITHLERATMVMTARFVLMAWRSHVEQHPAYSVQVQFISRESYNIFITICDGLLSLIILYRQFHPGYPLLPWLHGTENCEHIFGTLRQLKTDFNYMDLLYLQPKLQTLLLAAFSHILPQQEANATAAGYHHSYILDADIDLQALTQWPTDAQLTEASQRAFENAAQLLQAVGIDAKTMLSSYQHPASSSGRCTQQSEPRKPRGPTTLAELIALYDASAATISFEEQDKIEACQAALISEGINKTLKINMLPDSEDAELQSVAESINSDLQAVPAGELNTIVSNEQDSSSTCPQGKVTLFSIDSDEPFTSLINSTTSTLIPEALVKLRARHEPPFVARAIRQSARQCLSNGNNSEANNTSESTLRQTLVTRLATLTYDAITSSSSSGVARRVRHTGSYQATGSGTREGQKRTIQAASSASFCALRMQAFAHLQAIHPNMYNANISLSSPLNPGNFVLVSQSVDVAVSKLELLLGRVVTMYTKSEGRGSKHAWTASVDSVGTPSYIAVQIYSHFAGSTYSANSCKKMDCPTFLNVPRTHVVLSLADYAKTITTGGINVGTHEVDTVTLCAASARLHLALTLRHDDISKAIKQLCGLCKRGAKAARHGSVSLTIDQGGGSAQAWAAAINEPRSTGDDSDDVLSDDPEGQECVKMV
ncbi:hypothetical protein BC835DRAFT_878998 [Cytidiella melzeri]|nr:hypothetical protein BC835DRAFT_878998 [Cytidiella melzeri]